MLSVKDIKLPKLKMPDFNAAKDIKNKAKDMLQDKDPVMFFKKINPFKNKKKVKVYKWKNKEGVWVFSDHPNPDGPYETFTIDPSKDLIHPDVSHHSKQVKNSPPDSAK